MNGLVAAMAGTLKDADGSGGAGIESPIFAHKDFERLEAQGAAKVGDKLEQARGEIARLLKKK